MFTQLTKIVFILNHLLVGTCCSFYILYVDNKPKNFLIEWWSLKLLRLFNVKVIVNKNLKNILRKKNYLIVSNHISWLDIFIINSICPVIFVNSFILGIE